MKYTFKSNTLFFVVVVHFPSIKHCGHERSEFCTQTKKHSSFSRRFVHSVVVLKKKKKDRINICFNIWIKSSSYSFFFTSSIDFKIQFKQIINYFVEKFFVFYCSFIFLFLYLYALKIIIGFLRIWSSSSFFLLSKLHHRFNLIISFALRHLRS